MMRNVFELILLCSAAIGVSSAHAETFVLQADKAGHEATVKIPVGAVTKLSANFAQSLGGDADSQVEAMRLSGDVLISIAGSEQPIEIRADEVVLELTADSAPNNHRATRSDAATVKILRSTTTADGANHSQTFVGNVVFNLQTASGPMQIKADRVQHELRTEAGA